VDADREREIVSAEPASGRLVPVWSAAFGGRNRPPVPEGPKLLRELAGIGLAQMRVIAVPTRRMPILLPPRSSRIPEAFARIFATVPGGAPAQSEPARTRST